MIGIHKTREFEVYGVKFSGVPDLINLTHLKMIGHLMLQ